MYALTVCMWLKSNASPGVGTPFSYAVPGQANELVLIEWGNNPMEILINDKVCLKHSGDVDFKLFWFILQQKKKNLSSLFYLFQKFSMTQFRPVHESRFDISIFCLLLGCKAAFPHQWWEVASHLCDLDYSWWRVGGFPRWCQEGEWRESGSVSSHQTTGPADPRPRAGKHNTHLPQGDKLSTSREHLRCFFHYNRM